MKLIALLAFRDEEDMLPAFLSSVGPIADEIVAIDDSSTDGSRGLVEKAGAHVVENPHPAPAGWVDFHAIREDLLRIGRERGGTHFIGLDADEALTAPCRDHLREALEGLDPGQKLAMHWVTLWQRRDVYRNDGVWHALFKDFAFADGPELHHQDAFLSVARTPGPNIDSEWFRVPPERGAVLHYQFVPWLRCQVKQAWYRCSELLRTPDRAFEINDMYRHGLDGPEVKRVDVPPVWFEGLTVSEGIEDLKPAWHLDAMLAWFDDHGIEFFEPLQIWHVPQLHELFVERVGREPRPRLRPLFRERIRGVSNRAIAAAQRLGAGG